MPKWMPRLGVVRRLILAAVVLLAGLHPSFAGTWAALSSAPPVGVNHAMLLTDGTIYTDNGSGQCCRLTPDIHGNYQFGTWTHLATMNDPRLFFTSEMLTNGNIFVAGGEYGSGGRHAELFDPLRNTWSKIPDPLQAPIFSDTIGKLLPNGNVLTAPVSLFGPCLIYNALTNGWQTAATANNQNEVCWVRMSNDCILTVDTGTQNAEHYAPTLNAWEIDHTVPVAIYGYGAELGAGFLLPNGKVFYIGASTNTAIYTSGASVSAAGSWVAGPPMVFGANQLGAVDAPAAMMVTGNILCALGPIGGFNGPTSFYEYNYLSNAFTAESAPGGGSSYSASAPFGTSMLCLPNGTVLFIGGQNTQSLYVYTPSGAPLAQGQPGISSIAENADGSFLLTGTNLNGISAGAAYGDDEQMDSNYPLVRMTNSSTGYVYYGRTANWSSSSVMTGSKVITTKFTVPTNLPAGTYSLVAVANGNASAPTNFVYSPISAPTGLSAISGSNNLVRLSWNASANATAYNVKVCSNSTGYFTTLATVTGTTYTNAGLTNGVIYYYKVAAIGANGPSVDSAAVSATPSGPTPIPGAISVSLASSYNRVGISTDGRSISGSGLDGSGNVFSANLLGPDIIWNNLVFTFGPANASDSVYCNGQTINLPQLQVNTLQFLATAVNGGQVSETFTVNYTDGSSTNFTQSFSDWANPESFEGETPLINMYHRNTSSGGLSLLNVTLNAYIFVLDRTKTVMSVTLPSDSSLILFAMDESLDPAPVALDAYYNRAGITSDGTAFTNPPTGGVDGDGNAYSGTLLGPTHTWTNTLFEFGSQDETNVISCEGEVVALLPGNYSKLRMIAAAVNGSQSSKSFMVTYADGSTTTFIQSFSDWSTPAVFSGETKAIPMSYRNSSDGSSSQNSTFYLYGYTFVLSPTKQAVSITLPTDKNLIIAAMTEVPDYPPSFAANAFTLPFATVGSPYSASVASDATELSGDPITYTELSGPGWVTVSPGGAVTGTPSSSDLNLNTLYISATNANGMSNSAVFYIYVDAPPYFLEDPFAEPDATAGQLYSVNIATNAADPNPTDALTFGYLAGPTWLNVASNGVLSGTPNSSDVGTNAIEVSVADPYGLSDSAIVDIIVDPAPAIMQSLSMQGGQLVLTWAGGAGPFQVQTTTDLTQPWQDVGAPISTNSIVISPTNQAAFYRIVGD